MVCVCFNSTAVFGGLVICGLSLYTQHSKVMHYMKTYLGLTRAFQGGSPPFPILSVVFRRQLGVVAVFYVSVGTQCSKVVHVV